MATPILTESPPSRGIARTEALNAVETKLGQLKSLLSCCYGMGQEWLEEMGPTKRDDIMWIASDLADDAVSAFRKLVEADHG